MPIYEYRCEPCAKTFETLIRNNGDTPRCPDCGTIEVAKQFSVPASVHSNGASSLPVYNAPAPGFGCGGGGCGAGGCSID
ncbi:zinc ribbon domain-containing protein [Isosphaeraceae bacterium EP7]